MRLDDKLAALDNHAARRIDVREWEHLRILARAEGDSVIVAECDYRIAKLTARTRAQEAMLAVGRLRESLNDLERCEVSVASSVDHAVAAAMSGPLVLHLTITIRVDAPDEATP